MEKIRNYINGELCKPASDQYLEVFEPATGKPYALVPDSSKIDVENAYDSAKKAFMTWSSISIEERSAYLNAIADKKPNNVANPVTLLPPRCTASGIIAAAIIVNIAPAASPSIRTTIPWSTLPPNQ